MQWKCRRYNLKEANVEIDMLCRFFKMNACNSLTNHDTDVVEDPLWQVHGSMLAIPWSEYQPSDKTWAQIALKPSLVALDDEAMMLSALIDK